MPSLLVGLRKSLVGYSIWRVSRSLASICWVLVIRGCEKVSAYALRLLGYVKKKRKQRGDLMKTRRLAVVVLAILIMSALSATGVSAQDIPQQAQSGDLVLPTNTTGEFDTGNKQMSVTKPGQSDTNSSQQTLDPQGKQPRERRDRNNNDDLIPTEAAPSSGTSANPTGSGGSGGALALPAAPAPKAQLPKTGGSSVASQFAMGAGLLLVGGGLLARRIIK